MAIETSRQRSDPPQRAILPPGWDLDAFDATFRWKFVIVILIVAALIFAALAALFWYIETRHPTVPESQREAQAVHYSQTTGVTNSPTRQDTE